MTMKFNQMVGGGLRRSSAACLLPCREPGGGVLGVGWLLFLPQELCGHTRILGVPHPRVTWSGRLWSCVLDDVLGSMWPQPGGLGPRAMISKTCQETDQLSRTVVTRAAQVLRWRVCKTGCPSTAPRCPFSHAPLSRWSLLDVSLWMVFLAREGPLELAATARLPLSPEPSRLCFSKCLCHSVKR